MARDNSQVWICVHWMDTVWMLVVVLLLTVLGGVVAVHWGYKIQDHEVSTKAETAS